MTLSEPDRNLIARSRLLAGVTDGEGATLLARLAGLVERLEADNSRLRNDRARHRAQLALPPDDDDREALREAGSP